MTERLPHAHATKPTERDHHMGTTENQPQDPRATSSLDGGKTAYGRDDYPMLSEDPAGRSTKPSQSDLTPRQTLHDPDDIEVKHVGPSMSVAKDVSPSLPFRGPVQHGAGTTTSTTADQMQRQLDNDLAIRDAIRRDGQDPESFRIERGYSSGRGVNEPTKSSDDLRADLYRQSGASEEDIAWDRLNRGR